MLIPDREQKVVLKGAWSGVLTVISRVPQGSVLGPFLFLVNIDDVMRVNFPTDCKLTVYAGWRAFVHAHGQDWRLHIDSICSKAKRLLGLLYRRFYLHASPQALLEMYLTLVRPHTKYASSAWIPTAERQNSFGGYTEICKMILFHDCNSYTHIIWCTESCNSQNGHEKL